MPMTNEFAADYLNHLLNNAPHTDVGDAAGLLASAANGDVFCSLHTGDPLVTGDQESNECDYTSYARVAVDRDGAAWTVVAKNASNAAAITFPAKTGGDDDTGTHIGIGSAASGAGHLYASAALDNPIEITDTIEPYFGIGEFDVDLT
jgi:hypothetical protein